MSAPVTHLHIERIVIDGIPLTQAEARQLKVALQTELARLFDASWRPDWQGATLDRLSAPALTVGLPLQPLALGQAIARSVHASLVRAR